jgi:hypothetical protein
MYPDARQRRRFAAWTLIGLWFAATAMAADKTLPQGPFTEPECVACHLERGPGLVTAWRTGPHGDVGGAGCSDCHGERHAGANAAARRDRACTGCHQGSETHSYATSKHGVIVRMQGDQQDWGQPLQRGRYRVPGCAYCHLHDSDHGDTMARERGP